MIFVAIYDYVVTKQIRSFTQNIYTWPCPSPLDNFQSVEISKKCNLHLKARDWSTFLYHYQESQESIVCE